MLKTILIFEKRFDWDYARACRDILYSVCMYTTPITYTIHRLFRRQKDRKDKLVRHRERRSIKKKINVHNYLATISIEY